MLMLNAQSIRNKTTILENYIEVVENTALYLALSGDFNKVGVIAWLT